MAIVTVSFKDGSGSRKVMALDKVGAYVDAECRTGYVRGQTITVEFVEAA